MFSGLHRMLPFLGGRGGRLATEANANDQLQGQHSSQNGAESKEMQPRSRASLVGRMKTRSRHNEYLVDDDISRGRELHKLPAVSYKRRDKAPLDFHYVVDQIHFESVQVNRSLAKVACCSCEDDCSDGQCFCGSTQPSRRYYDSKGRLHPDFNLDAPPVIFECNAACRCNRKRCKNMVIQNGCKHRLMLFRTKSRGWGIKTMEHLKRGTFVGLYSGELIPTQDSGQRHDDTYLFNLAHTQVYLRPTPDQPVEAVETRAADGTGSESDSDAGGSSSIMSDAGEQVVEAAPKQEEPKQVEQQHFVCDAKFYGNFTRFVNHSCKPNVIGIRSFTSHQDPKFPHIAFFTNQDVPAHTELTLNYGDNYWLVKCKRDSVYCLCKQPNCRFDRKNFPNTLKQHQQHQEQK